MIYELFKKCNLEFFDSPSKLFLDKKEVSEILEDFLKKEINEKEAAAQIEALKFKSFLIEYNSNESNKEIIFENYKQYKNILKSDKYKLKQFYIFSQIKDPDKFLIEYNEWLCKNSYPEEFYEEKLRKNLLLEQRNTCVMCGQQEFYYFHLHHIDYNKKNCDKSNLIFLCPRCHAKTGFNREFWKIFLIEKKKHIC
jgi:hypothetical protein